MTPGVQGEPLLRQHCLFWHWSEKQQSSEVWQLPNLGGTQGRQPLAGPKPTQCLSQPGGGGDGQAEKATVARKTFLGRVVAFVPERARSRISG